MSDQPLDLRRSMQVIRRHWIAVSAVALLGAGAGAGYTAYKPPMVSSSALVQLSTGAAATMANQVVIAGSDQVLSSAIPKLTPRLTLARLHPMVKVTSLSNSILSITGSGKTADQAQQIASVVANSYVTWVSNNNKNLPPAQKITASRFGPASAAAGPSKSSKMIFTGVIGLIVGLLVGSIGALAMSRSDRRLRQRDQIADAIGVPVLASLPVLHVRDAAHWSTLFDDYEPSVSDAWRLRNALHYLGLFDSRYPQARHGGGQSVTVLSLSTDKKALALGPQLAAFAASRGVSTVLAIGRNEESSVTATLRVACTAQPPRRNGNLRLIVADHDDPGRPSDSVLTVRVTVVDGKSPTVADAPLTQVTVLGVTAGTTTAEQLARVATSVATHGGSIDGILIADPDPADQTTGRIPQLVRPARNSQPTRMTGLTTETSR